MRARSPVSGASSNACFSRTSKGQTMESVVTSMASAAFCTASWFTSMPRARK